MHKSKQKLAKIIIRATFEARDARFFYSPGATRVGGEDGSLPSACPSHANTRCFYNPHLRCFFLKQKRLRLTAKPTLNYFYENLLFYFTTLVTLEP